MTPTPDHVPGKSGEAHPLDGAFITTESIGGPDAAKRSATFKVAFAGEGCIERVHAAEDYIKALVVADLATTQPAEQSASSPVEGEDLMAVPRWVFRDFLDNQPGWPDTARRYLDAPALTTRSVAVDREAVDEAVAKITVLRDQARNGTAVSDPNEWEADELDAILALISPAHREGKQK